MKGLAIYTIVLFGIMAIGVISEVTAMAIGGLALFSPSLVFAILYLVKKDKKPQAFS